MAHNINASNPGGINRDAGLGLTPEEVRRQVEALQALSRAREAEFAENRRKFFQSQLREAEEQRKQAEEARMARELAEAWERARRQSWKAWHQRNSHKINGLIPFTHGTKFNQWE